jgi:hypothetical protein
MTERKKREFGEVRVFGGVLHARVTIEGGRLLADLATIPEIEAGASGN